jgi:polysaccharide export outer membrane protein
MMRQVEHRLVFFSVFLGLASLVTPPAAPAQQAVPPPAAAAAGMPAVAPQTETTEEFNRRLENLRKSFGDRTAQRPDDEYRIGAHDLLEINVFEAPELNRSLRVSAAGDISMPLAGAVHSAGLTARELEAALEFRLRAYMKDPRVGVFVSSVESHPVSVVGAVKKPGVFQVRGAKSLLEMLSLAEGLSDDAGDAVLVMRGAGLRFGADSARDPVDAVASAQQPASAASGAPAPPGAEFQTVRVNLRELLESADPRSNVPVYPGDIVKVTRAGIVYVVGDVKKPGGFVMRSDEKISVLKAVALAEGLTVTSAKSKMKIIRTDSAGERQEIPIDIDRIVAGKVQDPVLKPADILFVPHSTGKAALSRGSEAAFSAVTGLLIFRW